MKNVAMDIKKEAVESGAIETLKMVDYVLSELYDDAYNMLCRWIRRYYIKIVRKNNIYKSRKVWHNG